jgi:hypothetical protein
VLSSAKRIPEQEFLSDPSGFRAGLVVFSGMGGFFSEFVNEYDYIRTVLVRSALPKHTVGLHSSIANSISVHVRLGDFLDEGSHPATQPNVRQSIAWYVHTIRELQTVVGEVRVNLFSDGHDSELRPLLDLPNVRRLFYGSSLADLFALSAAKVLVASASTFSMWAAYLGRMPVIWPPHGRVQRLHPDHWPFEPEVGFEGLPQEVVSLIRRQFDGARETAAAFPS